MQTTVDFQPVLSELQEPDFSYPRPFIFCVNATSLHSGWTPWRLERQLGYTEYGLLEAVRVRAVLDNTDPALKIAVAWAEQGIPVEFSLLCLPALPLRGDLYYGFTPRRCYFHNPLAQSLSWEPKPWLVNRFRDLLSCYPKLVRVNPYRP